MAPRSSPRLRRLVPAAAFLWLAAAATAAQLDREVELQERLAAITAQTCLAQVEVLAAPTFGGRATPSRGLDQAAQYLEEQLAAMGLAPAVEAGYRLPYSLKCLVAGGASRVSWRAEGGAERALRLGDDFVPVPGSKEVGAAGPALFVGYAIDAQDERWQDLMENKVKGKVVFAFTREPRADDAKYKSFDGARNTKHSNFGSKAAAAAKAGAVALVLVPDPAGHDGHDGPVPDLLPMVLNSNMSASRLGQVAGWPDIPVVSVSRAAAEELFGADLAEFQAGIDAKKKPRLLEPAQAKTVVDLAVRWEEKEQPFYNLAAKIAGSDGDGEVVVLGAHLDHVGQDYFLALLGNKPAELHPGADDNASGSAALLEVARALAGSQPQEDLLFLWFTGEELNLLGSRAYCDAPLYPHDRTIAMLNMDMVGRGDPKKANVGGLWELPEWEKLIRAQAKRVKSKLKLDLDQGRDLYARSDQYSFHQEKVVGLFFFEADLEANKDYHTPTDTADKIDGEKMAQIARLFLATAFALAHEGERP